MHRRAVRRTAAGLTLAGALLLPATAAAVSFSALGPVPMGGTPNALAVADFDADGLPDVAGTVSASAGPTASPCACRPASAPSPAARPS
ncbi:VCBS repeat-containing protein [Conexibacter sp. JD483]|uniref:FG-GAP repeat domain-containing protein n=1 Tax=unclassified Conexibacter TaxID=2627773 RepID=UPI00272850E2|nr:MULTISPECIES: VCBS repeat-containing protein [unclassified Conexibacter]MDO8184604.1 VCBS repeat-containing protein [Conexibacter sp. CPCC 205706]MDO8197910.1 VCBS repeat-containing protein [Conexibacter sp. CPCC 205762]MDR9370125.1 VCBS repeat-containing protein [Conexibacter sp. JD483]